MYYACARWATSSYKNVFMKRYERYERFYERFIQLYRDTYLKRDSGAVGRSVFDSGIVGKLLQNLEIEYAKG